MALFISHDFISPHISILWLFNEFVAKVFTMYVSTSSNMFIVHVIYVRMYVKMDVFSFRFHVLRPLKVDLMWFGNWDVISPLHINLCKVLCLIVLVCDGFHLILIQLLWIHVCIGNCHARLLWNLGNPRNTIRSVVNFIL